MLGELWERLGIGEALREVSDERRLEAHVVERVLFCLVANRCLEAPSLPLCAGHQNACACGLSLL